MRFWSRDLLHMWFHTLSPADWFGSSEAVDEQLRRRYAKWLTALGQQAPQEFLRSPATARAAILLFDQVPRNLYRGSGQAFAYDGKARAICDGMISRGWDRALSRPQAQFVYMPLMHSEAIADQRRSVRYFTALGSSFVIGFARDHHAMIARFGRFPHRNEVLGRRSTPAEIRAVAAGNHW